MRRLRWHASTTLLAYVCLFCGLPGGVQPSAALAVSKAKRVYAFKLTKPVESGDRRFEDDSIAITFQVDPAQLAFTLFNKTDGPIKILWNDVSYVDVDGSAHKVLHAGVKYIDANSQLPPVVVPPTAKAEDIILPSDYVSYDKGYYGRYISMPGGWKLTPLFPKADKKEALAYDNRTFAVFMPLEINGTVKNYNFVFSMSIVEISK